MSRLLGDGGKICRQHRNVLIRASGGFANCLVLDKLMLHSWLDSPIVSLSWVVLWSLLLDESLIETEIMSNAVLPSSIRSTVEFVGI